MEKEREKNVGQSPGVRPARMEYDPNRAAGRPYGMGALARSRPVTSGNERKVDLDGGSPRAVR